jgi:hypothetical protein
MEEMRRDRADRADRLDNKLTFAGLSGGERASERVGGSCGGDVKRWMKG